MSHTFKCHGQPRKFTRNGQGSLREMSGESQVNSKVWKKICVFTLCVTTLCLCELSPQGCRGPDVVISGNEGLRLTPAEIQLYTSRARAGDAKAAKKLWHHYEFVEYDHRKGQYWKTEYDRLSQNH